MIFDTDIFIWVQRGNKKAAKIGDAIIAATAVENNLTLVSGNRKHFRMIKELRFKGFTP